jgi:hypothetical protein
MLRMAYLPAALPPRLSYSKTDFPARRKHDKTSSSPPERV